MHRFAPRALGACVGLLGAGAASANVVIDSEHRAVGGLYTALRLLDEVPANYAVLAYSPRDFTDRALRLLNAAWTPATLTAQPGGADVACPAAGSFHATYAKRILDLAFTGCGIDSGSANYSWPAGSGRECHSGGYTFATPTQLTRPDYFASDAWSAGVFSINGAATFTFRKNPNNSPLGAMHVHLEIVNAGAFDDDGDSLGAMSLGASAECQN